MNIPMQKSELDSELERISYEMLNLAKEIAEVKSLDMPPRNKEIVLKDLENRMGALEDQSRTIELTLEPQEQARLESIELSESGALNEKFEQEKNNRRIVRLDAINELIKNNPELYDEYAANGLDAFFSEHKDELHEIILRHNKEERERQTVKSIEPLENKGLIDESGVPEEIESETIMETGSETPEEETEPVVVTEPEVEPEQSEPTESDSESEEDQEQEEIDQAVVAAVEESEQQEDAELAELDEAIRAQVAETEDLGIANPDGPAVIVEPNEDSESEEDREQEEINQAIAEQAEQQEAEPEVHDLTGEAPDPGRQSVTSLKTAAADLINKIKAPKAVQKSLMAIGAITVGAAIVGIAPALAIGGLYLAGRWVAKQYNKGAGAARK